MALHGAVGSERQILCRPLTAIRHQRVACRFGKDIRNRATRMQNGNSIVGCGQVRAKVSTTKSAK